MRFSPNSLDVVYIAGFGAHPPAPMVTVSRTDGTEVAIAPGHHPGWPASVHIVFCPPEDGVVLIADVMTGFVRPSDIPAGNTLTAAAGKVAVHRTDPRRVLTSFDWTLNGVTDPVLSADGRWMAYLRPDVPHEGVSLLTIEQIDDTVPHPLRRDAFVGAPTRPRFSHTGTSLCWEGGNGQIYGIADVANPQSPVVKLSRDGDRLYAPVPFWHPQRAELFVLALQTTGPETADILLMQWATAWGYRLGASGGSAYDHDICYHNLDADLAYLSPTGSLVRLDVDLDATRHELPLPPAPEPPVELDWSFVPDGTLVTDAFRAMFGAQPCLSPDGKRLCLHKNVNEQEWREIGESGLVAYHLFDRSRYPGDIGWYLYADGDIPTWATNQFRSGQSVGFDGEIVEMADGRRNRWTHTNTLYGLTAGGVCVQFDPRFPGQDYGEEKCYERQFTRLDGHIRWELWYSPEAARALEWGDRSLDVLKQAVEGTTDPGAATPPYIECPRLSVSDDPWAQTHPPDPQEPDMTHANLRSWAGEILDTPLFGALQRFHNEVLPRDRAELAIIEAEDGSEMWTGDVTTGGANGYFVRVFMTEYFIARDTGRTPEQAIGDGYDAAFKSYTQAVNPPQPPQPGTFSGPIGVSGESFTVPE